ncbi:hypothetical protein MASR1M66_14960 [Aminivibrio sp.]
MDPDGQGTPGVNPDSGGSQLEPEAKITVDQNNTPKKQAVVSARLHALDLNTFELTLISL